MATLVPALMTTALARLLTRLLLPAALLLLTGLLATAALLFAGARIVLLLLVRLLLVRISHTHSCGLIAPRNQRGELD
jgi:hypothetical protein